MDSKINTNTPKKKEKQRNEVKNSGKTPTDLVKPNKLVIFFFVIITCASVFSFSIIASKLSEISVALNSLDSTNREIESSKGRLHQLREKVVVLVQEANRAEENSSKMRIEEKRVDQQLQIGMDELENRRDEFNKLVKKRDIAELETEKFRGSLKNISETISSREQELIALEKERDDLSNNNKKLSDSNYRLKEQVETLNQELEELVPLKSELNSVRQTVKLLREAVIGLSELNASVTLLENQKEVLEISVGRLTSTQATLNSDNELMSQSIIKNKNELASIEGELTSLEGEIKAEKNSLTLLREESARLGVQVSSTKSKLNNLKQDLELKNVEIASIKADILSAQKDKDSLAEFSPILSNAKADFETAKAGLRSIEKNRESLIGEIASLTTKNQTLKTERDSLLPVVSRLSTEIAESKKSLDSLRIKTLALKTESINAKESLQETESKARVSLSKRNAIVLEIKDAEERRQGLFQEIAESRKSLDSSRNQASVFVQESIQAQASLQEAELNLQAITEKSNLRSQELETLEEKKLKLSQEILTLEAKKKSLNN